ncbi:MAG: rane protein [Pseudomonas sp.]|nr:rane protein [Pseudomonas sp.]
MQRDRSLGWLNRFIPATLNTRPKEWFRASIGTSLGLLVSTLICSQVFGTSVALHLMGPMAASAVILFAVSSGALAQPWPVIGGYMTSTAVALILTHYFGYSLEVGAGAVGLSLGAMCVLRCLHPPAAALSLCLVLADGELTGMSWHVLYPVMLYVLGLVIAALLYNNVTGVRYPKMHPAADTHHTHDPAPLERVGITSVDLELALADIGEFVDVTREELEDIVRTTEKYALRRSMGDITAGQIMSRDLQCATPETSLDQALKMLTSHHLKTLPVLDEERKLVGIVSLIDLLGHPLNTRRFGMLGRLGLSRRVTLAQVMSHPVTLVQSDAHVVELIPLLSGVGLHSLPVMENGELVGIVTQTDLIAALHRDLIMHLA